MSALDLNRAKTAAVALLCVVYPVSATKAAAQGSFVAGARTIVNLDFAAEPVGDVPKGLRPHSGTLDVVDKDGVHMLRASSPSDFVLHLPENLPKNFTIEFDLIPKACCNPVDLMVEGVTSGSRSSVSAQIEWDADHFAVVGGNPEMFQMDMPTEVAAALPSRRTKVALSFQDETINMYTNGTRVYTLTNRKFARRNVLHISLGGADEDKHAVYLASVRVADLAPLVVASNAAEPGSGSSTTGGAGNLTTPTVAGVKASFDAQGRPTVSWQALEGASTYFVIRWLEGDPTCCNNTSPAQGMNRLSWEDVAVPKGGNYGFRVYANTLTGIYTGEARAEYKPATTTVGILQPIAGSQPTPIIGAIKGPDTTIAQLNFSSTSQPFGYIIAWTNVPGATSYRVFRTTPTSAGVLRGTVPRAQALFAGSDLSLAVDPEIGSDAAHYQYYVDAVFADGSRSEPGSVTTPNPNQGTPSVGWNTPLPLGLTVSVGGPTAITFNGQQTRGSRVTWDWDTSAAPATSVYFISVDVAQESSSFGLAWTNYRSGPVQRSTTTPVPYLTSGIAGPPYQLTLPTGWYVRFCVSYFPVTDVQRQNAELSRSGCTVSQMPL